MGAPLLHPYGMGAPLIHGVAVRGGGAPPPTWAQIVAALPGLWGWWRFDTNPNGAANFADSSGNGRSLGTFNLSGNVAGLVANDADQAYQRVTFQGNAFTPSTGYPANCPSQNNLAFGFGVLVKQVSDLSAFASVMGWGACGTAHSGVFFGLNNQTPYAGTNSGDVAWGSQMLSGTAHLYVVNYDGAGNLTLFVDNLGSVSASITALSVPGSGANSIFHVFDAPGLPGQHGIEGVVDEPFVCTTPISTANISALWHAFSGT